MELTFGRGLKDPNKLCERLHLLVAAKLAGNNNKRLDQKIANILKKLKLNKCISHCDHQKLFDNILTLSGLGGLHVHALFLNAYCFKAT